MEITGLSRNNICEMQGVCDSNGSTFNRSNESFPCFHAAFAFMDRVGNKSKTYTIDYTLYMRKNYDGTNNNFVLLSKKNMCRLLNSFKKSIPFTYHFDDNNSFYMLNMHLSGTALQHKGLLMLSRMLFEYPHNVCAVDALKMRSLGKVDGFDFKNMSLTSLYTLCISSTHFSEDECLICHHTPELVNTKELGKRLRVRNRRTISNVLGRRGYQPQIIEFRQNQCLDLEEAGFNRRYNAYKHNLERNLRHE